MATSLSPQDALSRLEGSKMKRLAPSVSRKNELKHDFTIGHLYVFSPENGVGYVILPDNDVAPVILGYSDSGIFDIEDNPALKEWLSFYNAQLEKVTETDERDVSIAGIVRPHRTPIEPLTKTKWNQESPYNELCPKVDGRETVTGCVATAMAQMMKFHNYPEHGKGTHSYYWEPGAETLSYDYENTEFQWSLMTDTYDRESSEESRKAVAELMLGCGISVDMHYDVGESGAATTLMGEALIDIFGYSPSLWMPNRVFYGYDEWEEMIYGELAKGLPVLYSGAGTAGGHQFICDGYSSDGFFHFNWGWGGLSDGYFLLTALNPDSLGVGGGAGGFNSSQVATLGCRPPEAGDKPVYIMYNVEGFIPDVHAVSAGEYFRCKGTYYNYSLHTLPEGACLGMKFVSKDTGEIRYVEGPSVEGIKMNYGRYNDQIRFPELSDGAYIITPALFAGNEWSDVRMPVGYPAQVTAEVKDNHAVIVDQDEAKVRVENIVVPSVIYRYREFPMQFMVVNTGELEFYDSVTPYLIDDQGNVIAVSEFRPCDVLAGESEVVNDYIGNFKQLKDVEFPAGEYKIVFRDIHNNDLNEPVTVKVEILEGSTEIAVTGFKLDDSEPVHDPESVSFNFTVECREGLYYGSPRLFVFPANGGYDVYNKASERIYLTSGEKRDVTLTANFESLPDGRYMAIIYEGNTAATDRVYFVIDRIATGISSVSGDSVESAGRIYGIDGSSRKDAHSPGLYIIDGKLILVR